MCGIALLTLALFISARMGIYQEVLYKRYGKYPKEALYVTVSNVFKQKIAISYWLSFYSKFKNKYFPILSLASSAVARFLIAVQQHFWAHGNRNGQWTRCNSICRNLDANFMGVFDFELPHPICVHQFGVCPNNRMHIVDSYARRHPEKIHFAAFLHPLLQQPVHLAALDRNAVGICGNADIHRNDPVIANRQHKQIENQLILSLFFIKRFFVGFHVSHACN